MLFTSLLYLSKKDFSTFPNKIHDKKARQAIIVINNTKSVKYPKEV